MTPPDRVTAAHATLTPAADACSTAVHRQVRDLIGRALYRLHCDLRGIEYTDTRYDRMCAAVGDVPDPTGVDVVMDALGPLLAAVGEPECAGTPTCDVGPHDRDCPHWRPDQAPGTPVGDDDDLSALVDTAGAAPGPPCGRPGHGAPALVAADRHQDRTEPERPTTEVGRPSTTPHEPAPVPGNAAHMHRAVVGDRAGELNQRAPAATSAATPPHLPVPPAPTTAPDRSRPVTTPPVPDSGLTTPRPGLHPVAVVVVGTAEGHDPRDAHDVAAQALTDALGPDPVLRTTTWAGLPRTTTVHHITPIGQAFHEHTLVVRPNLREHDFTDAPAPGSPDTSPT